MQVGRLVFDEFLNKYIWYFKFQSIDIDSCLAFPKNNLPSIENEVDLDVWVDGTRMKLIWMKVVDYDTTKVMLNAE